MPEIWMLTRRQFIGDWRIDDSDLADVERISALKVDELTRGWIRSSLKPLPNATGYYIAGIRRQPLDVALLHWHERHEEWDVVGGYVEDILWLDILQRGRGLSLELVLAKADLLDGVMEPESYTTAGRNAHASAHKLAVRRAMQRGCRIPSHVMADYPELADGGVLSEA